MIEYLLREHQQLPRYDKKDALASIGMAVGSAVINVGSKTVAFLAYSWLYEHRLFEIGSAWWAWVLLFFADDFSFYLHHRSCHEIRLFWVGGIVSQVYLVGLAAIPRVPSADDHHDDDCESDLPVFPAYGGGEAVSEGD